MKSEEWIMLILNNLTIINDILNFYLIFINSFLFSLSLTFFYLDNFRISNIRFIKIIQIFSFICIPIFITYNLFNESNIYLSDIVSYANENRNNKDVNLHGNISINAEAARVLNQGMQAATSNIGLAGTIAGVSTAVSKAIAKSGMPPLQKAGIIMSSGLLSGIGHSLLSNVNRNATNGNTIITSAASSSNSHAHKFLNINNSDLSPLQEFLHDGEMMNYVCLSLIYFLIIQLIFKLYFKDSIKFYLKFLSNNVNTKIEFYLNKIIRLNKQMSVMWIWYIFAVILSGLSVFAYALHNVCVYIDSYINGHISFHTNLRENISSIPMSDKSFIYQFNYLEIINFSSIIVIIFLISLIFLKFQLNKSIKNIYIWLLIFILILTLTFSVYIINDLIINVNSYVKFYLSLK